LYSKHLKSLLTLGFPRRRKEIISNEDEVVEHADTPKERGVVLILVTQ
jgi:hypothetical protein